MAKVGRPLREYDEAVASQFLEYLKDGLSSRKTCKKPGMPCWNVLWNWLDANEEFKERYYHARRLGFIASADDLEIIADDESRDQVPDGRGGYKSDNTAVNRDKLRIWTRQWNMAKQYRELFGDKVTNEITGKDGGPIQTQAVDAPPQETREEWLERRAREQANVVH